MPWWCAWCEPEDICTTCPVGAPEPATIGGLVAVNMALWARLVQTQNQHRNRRQRKYHTDERKWMSGYRWVRRRGMGLVRKPIDGIKTISGVKIQF